jgi:uncharacterized OB-fold protein
VAEPRIIEAQTPRMLPELHDENRAYWTGGAVGQLLIHRCHACDRWVHPPAASCPGCGGPSAPEPVSGRGTVFSFTINEQQFHPDVPPPYDIAIVVLEEQDDLRIITNIVGCELDELAVGMPVQVLFEQHGEVFVPLFEPTTD